MQIVESFREGKSVRQRFLATVGRLDILQHSGQLEGLIRSGARFCEKLAVIDAHNAGNTEPVSVKSIGPDLVFSRLWEETHIGPIIRKLLSNRCFQFPLERAVYLTVLHRLFCPGSDRAAEKWRESFRIPGAESLELHHFYRTMGWLGEALDNQTDGLGQPHCNKDKIEEALFDRRRDLFSEIDMVFFDTTSIYFEGEGGQTLGEHGHSKDHRPDLKQMIVGLALDVQGRPICCQMWPGNTTDVKTLIPVVKDIKRRFGVHHICIVADRGMMSKQVVKALESQQVPCTYILGVRMRRVKDIAEHVLKSPKPFFEINPERKKAKDPSPLKVKEVIHEGKRFIVCLNEEQRRKDKIDREAIVEKLKSQLKKGDKTLVANKGFRKFLQNTSDEHFKIDEIKIKEDTQYDGMWVLQTNTDLETESVALSYKQLWMVEDLFRTMKSILETRPIYHKCDDTIRGHVFCSFLALVLRSELESRLAEKDISFEWKEILRGLENLYEVETNFQGKKYLLRSRLIAQAKDAFVAAGVAIPPTAREIE